MANVASAPGGQHISKPIHHADHLQSVHQDFIFPVRPSHRASIQDFPEEGVLRGHFYNQHSTPRLCEWLPIRMRGEYRQNLTELFNLTVLLFNVVL